MFNVAYFLKSFKIITLSLSRPPKYLRLPLMEAFVTVTSFAVSNQTSFCLVFKESEKDNSKMAQLKIYWLLWCRLSNFGINDFSIFFLIFQNTLHLKFRSSYMEEVKSSYSKTPLQQRPYNQKVQRPSGPFTSMMFSTKFHCH